MLVGKILIAVGVLALVVPGLLLILKGLWTMFAYAIVERSLDLLLLALFLTGPILIPVGILCLKWSDTPDAQTPKEILEQPNNQ